MRINPKEILFGQPILRIREVVRQTMQQRLWGTTESEIIDKVAIILLKSETVAKQVVKQMIHEDFIILNKVKYGEAYQYELTETDKGRRFGIATAAPPISREKATQLLNELIDRAKAINVNDELVYFVESIKVFGSYLSDKDTLGDLDVGVKLSRKHENDNFSQHNQQRINLAKTKGRNFNNYFEEICWPHREVMLMLKGRQRGLSLHDEEIDEVLKITETKLVYQYRGSMTDQTN